MFRSLVPGRLVSFPWANTALRGSIPLENDGSLRSLVLDSITLFLGDQFSGFVPQPPTQYPTVQFPGEKDDLPRSFVLESMAALFLDIVHANLAENPS